MCRPAITPDMPGPHSAAAGMELCQRLSGQALEPDEGKIRRRIQERWRELKKEPKSESRTIVFIDESRLSQRPHGLGLGAPATRASVVGVSAGLHSGAEPG